MAKKTQTVVLELPPNAAEGGGNSDEERATAAERAAEYSRETAGMDEDDAQEFFSGLDELRTTRGVVFQVHRMEPIDRAGYCREYPANLFTLERVTKDYGPGVYKVRVKADGRYVPGGGSFKVAEGVPIEDRMPEQSSVQDVLAIIKADKEKSMERMKEWAVLLTPLLAPAIAKLFAGGSQVTELVTALGALQGLTPKPEKPPDMISQLDQISAMMVKLKEMSGTETNTTGATWIDLIRDAIQGAKPILEGIAVRAVGSTARPSPSPLMISPIPAPPSATPSAPTPVGSVAPATGTESSSPSLTPSSPQQPTSDPMLMLLGWLKATAEQLAEQAKRDKDPEFYAEVVADNLPDGTKPEQVLEYLARPDWWPMFSNFAPAVAPYPAWFAQFHEAFVELLREQIKKQSKPPAPSPDPVPEPEQFE